MRKVKKIGMRVCLLLVSAMVLCGVAQATEKQTAGLEKKLMKAPGNVEVRCEYVGVLLQAGDTIKAEEALDYGQKLGEAGCLYIHRARIALNRNKTSQAAIHCASAVNAGLLPEEESLIYYVDSVSGGAVATRLDRSSKSDKSGTNAVKGLGQIRMHEGDTAAALQCYKEAVRRGDTLLIALIDSLKQKEIVSEDSVVARIAFTRTNGKMEVQCKLNGLRIKAEVDTAATESTISGVETSFILKNEYVSKSEIVDNKVLIVRELDFGNGLILSGIRLHHRRSQESPVVLCLEDLRRLGKVVINEREKVLEVRR